MRGGGGGHESELMDGTSNEAKAKGRGNFTIVKMGACFFFKVPCYLINIIHSIKYTPMYPYLYTKMLN